MFTAPIPSVISNKNVENDNDLYNAIKVYTNQIK